MKGHSSIISYIWITQKSILFKTPKKPITTKTILYIFRLQKYFLLFLAICTCFSIFLIGYPILSCISDHNLLQSNRRFNHGIFIDTNTDNELWEQPNGFGYRPCLNYSKEYQALSNIETKKNRYLIVVVSGGLNQQKNQIIDAVVIARILEATLIIPILHVNPVWGDESEFSDIFDEQHFKKTLKDDVHVLSTLPATYITKRPARSGILPPHITEEWVQTQLMGQIKKSGVLILRRFDSRLSKNLKPDLQKLRCKVAFRALKFKPWIENLGEKLAAKMSHGRPFMALHLRLEKDVWIRTGCLPGLGKEDDRIINFERASHPEFLTSRSNLTARDRYIAGLCPLNPFEITRLLEAFGASRSTRIYWAGGMPFGGERTLQPIRSKFPHLTNKWDLADEGELDPLKNRSSILAALDYVVCLKSHVFMANHGGNMARSLQGHRAFLGHKKHITPNKKQLVKLFMNKDNTGEEEIQERIREMHLNSSGSPLVTPNRSNRDVVAYPVPDCMCTSSHIPI